MITEKSYLQLAAENRLLFEKAEDCTLMMGYSLLNGQDEIYKQYRSLRGEMLSAVDVNLELIQAIWDKPIISSIEDTLRKYNEKKIISLYKENQYYSATYIANKVGCQVKEVKQVIADYHHLKAS
jgi:hypothetical protein